MKKYSFVLTGIRPILFHSDDVMATDSLTAWRVDPKHKGLSTPGDDRSPAWTWIKYLYHDGKTLVIPYQNIMAALRKAGAGVPKAKGKGTFKTESQSGILILEENCAFTNHGKPVSMTAIAELGELSFQKQFDKVKTMGFDLLVKRAKVGTKKHVRVRAMFSDWKITGTLSVTEPLITDEVLTQMFEIAGDRVGLLDWRPASPESPGQYGRFTAEIKAE